MEEDQFMSDLGEFSAVQTVKLHNKTPEDLTTGEISRMFGSIKTKKGYKATQIVVALAAVVLCLPLTPSFLVVLIVASAVAIPFVSAYPDFAPISTFNALLLKAQNHTIPDRYQSYARFLKSKNSLILNSVTLESFYLNHPESKSQDLAVSPASSSSENKTWDNSFETFDKVYKEWFVIESDILRILAYPMYTDMRENVTVDFHKSLAYALSVEPELEDPYVFSHPFIQAVVKLEVAWKTLQSEAKRLKDTNFEPSERKRLSTSRNMLKIAFNAGASAAERQVAYKRALKELNGLLEISENAMFSIEAKAGLKQLEK